MLYGPQSDGPRPVVDLQYCRIQAEFRIEQLSEKQVRTFLTSSQ